MSVPDRDLFNEILEHLVEEFTSRYRDGQLPSISEYTARYPQHAIQIEELFPVVAAMEQIRADERSKREILARHTAETPQRLGDFQIVRQIGRGGMGVVYEAQQCSLSRPVAVKVLPKHALLLDKHLQRFQAEAKISARLRHTHIVPVYGVGEQDGLHYYVMPLVRGIGLDELIRSLRNDAMTGNVRTAQDILVRVRDLTAIKLDASSAPESAVPQANNHRSFSTYWQFVAQVGVQAAEALHYAHQQGTLHRDVKPGNLLLDEEGTVYVADFGLARAIDDSHRPCSDDYVGTARYMAPEQLQGIADARSDVYALGLTLYELLTLRPAFDQQRGTTMVAGQALPQPDPPRNLDPGIPRDLETIVLKCLAADPAKRYPSADALAADLRRFLEDRPIRARRTSLVERTARWCRRNPALATVSALALLSLVSLVATALTSYLHMRRAYADTHKALQQAEATSLVSLEVLDGIYARLSPGRIWIAWDSNPTGQACACMGLSAGDTSASSVERNTLQLRASRETALLLEGLLVFYDRLADQGDADTRIVAQSAVASRRVGDIRLCLGQIEQAEQAYLRAVDRLTSLDQHMPANLAVATELAHCYNEIGNVQSVRGQPAQACQSHQAALGVLQSSNPPEWPAPEYRYELARTFYFLARHAIAANSAPRQARPLSPSSPLTSGMAYRKSAIRILEELTNEHARAPEYRLLLALCHRDTAAPIGSAGGLHGRQRAIRILEDLVAQYPGVADYRYELVATCAWVPVGLFPWQGRYAMSKEDEQTLRKGLSEAERLVAQYPSVPHYTRSQAIVLAKLGASLWGSRRLAEAEEFFRKAVQTQSDLRTRFPDLPSHDRVLLDFFRLRLAQVSLERGDKDPSASLSSRRLAEQCIDSLTQLTRQPEVPDDQLAQYSLPLAYELLSTTLASAGEQRQADEAKKKAAAHRKQLRTKNDTPRIP